MKKDRYYYDTLMDELDTLLSLKDGWNGANSEAPNKIALSNAQAVLHAGLTENFMPDSLAASFNNGVGLTFVLEEKYLFIDCLNNGEIVFSVVNQDDEKVWKVKRGLGSIKSNLKIVRENGDI